MYVHVWYRTCASSVYLCLCTWDPIIVKYRGIVVNRYTKGSWTGVTEVTEIAVPRVVSSSRVGVDPFRYWWLGRLVGRNDWWFGKGMWWSG